MIKATLTNTESSTQEFDIACKSILPDPLYSESRIYVFLPEFQEYTREAGCWENKNPESDPYRTLECDETARLQPDESRSTSLVLWSATDDTHCMPVGEETFLTNLPFIEGANEEEWGFTISISQSKETP